MKKYYSKLPLLLCFLIAIAFSIKNLREPDLWWQIRTGEWILEKFQIPTQDVFSYTCAGTPWINVKWGFEVIAAVITKVSAPQNIYILQAIVSCLMVLLIYKTTQLFSAHVKSFSNKTIEILLAITLVAIEYRLNGRPEMFSHLFTLLFLYMLVRYKQAPGNWIYWLIPLQAIWANMHEAFGIGIVLTAIFCAAAWIEYYLWQRKWIQPVVPLPKVLSIVLVGCIAALVCNPQGVKLLLHPLNVFGQVYTNKYTSELAGFSSADYWQWNTYLSAILVVLGVSGTAKYFIALKTKTSKYKLFVGQWGVGYIITILAFLFLASTAYRNVVFLIIVFFPLLYFGVSIWIAGIEKWQLWEKYHTTAKVVLLLALYVFIVSDKYYEATNSHDRFGLGVYATNNPVGAAGFVKKQQLRGRCFSDYLTSSYLLWKLAPDFRTFIDLRDLDVFPPQLFDTFTEAVTIPAAFNHLDSAHHFGYVVLYRPQFANLHEYLFNESRFKLAYLDAVAAVYTPKTTPADSSIIHLTRFDGYMENKSLISSAVNYTMNPWYNLFERNYEQADTDLLAAAYAINVDRLADAEKFAERSALNGTEAYKGKQVLAEVYYHQATAAAGAMVVDSLLNKSLTMYKQALSEKNDFAEAWLGLGAVYFKKGNIDEARQAFEKCITIDSKNLNACLFAAACCDYYINRNQDAEANAMYAIKLYEKANRLNPDNPEITLHLGFLYFRIGDCSKCVKYLKQVVGYPGLTTAQQQQVSDCLAKCGH